MLRKYPVIEHGLMFWWIDTNHYTTMGPYYNVTEALSALDNRKPIKNLLASKKGGRRA